MVGIIQSGLRYYISILSSKTHHPEIRHWIEQGVDQMRELRIQSICFEGSDVWIKDRWGIWWYYFPELRLDFEHELIERQLLVSLLSPGDIFFDVGAYIGDFACRLPVLVKNLTVWAFEPSSPIFALLQRNIIRNRLEGVVFPYQVALSDSEGEVDLSIGLGAGNQLLTKSHYAKRDKRILNADRERVSQTTIDAFVMREGIEKVNLIKCDVEGAELLVMHGAQAVLTRFHPILLLEVEKRWTRNFGYEPIDLFRYLGECGYSHYDVITYSGKVESGSRYIPNNVSKIEQDLRKGRNFVFYYEHHRDKFCGA